MISALYVIPNGPYFIEGIDPWDEQRDARKFKGPGPVIAHPPCERWGRYWGGGPMLHGTELQKLLGDDEGCFAHALWSVRTFGGVLEHPEASHAFKYFGLPIPKQSGGWTESDKYGGRSCCVAQGNYGHKAEKLTWLYGVNIDFKDLQWGRKPGTGVCQRLSKRQRSLTPAPFRDLLISLVKESETL